MSKIRLLDIKDKITKMKSPQPFLFFYLGYTWNLLSEQDQKEVLTILQMFTEIGGAR